MRMMWLRRVDGTGVGAVCSVSVFVRAEDAVMAFLILSGQCCNECFFFGKKVWFFVIGEVTSEQRLSCLKRLFHGLEFQSLTIKISDLPSSGSI